mgnify:CR=1 FL=1
MGIQELFREVEKKIADTIVKSNRDTVMKIGERLNKIVAGKPMLVSALAIVHNIVDAVGEVCGGNSKCTSVGSYLSIVKVLPPDILDKLTGNAVVARMTGMLIGEKVSEIMDAASMYVGQVIDLAIKIRDEVREYSVSDRLASLCTMLISIFDSVKVPEDVKVMTILSLAVYASYVRADRETAEMLFREAAGIFKPGSNSVI